MAEETGWTLEYIDDLNMPDVMDWLAVKRGQAVANKPRGKT